ncbi:MAG: sensor histidine kinase [Synechococcaceae cyanobacterium SM2_3_1]|nr:sensor histidine kinase [Synechococcaceae cyanobacterium SM2_3_1]
MAFLVELLPGPPRPFPLLLSVLPILLIGLMGFWFPSRTSTKFLYVLLELVITIGAAELEWSRGGRTVVFLLLIVMMRGCILFNLTGRILVAVLTILLFAGQQFWGSSPPPLLRSFLRGEYRREADRDRERDRFRPRPRLDLADPDIRWIILSLRLNTVLQFGLIQGFVMLLINSLLSERQNRQQLQSAHQQLRAYALQIEDQAMIQERNRIAREIHDALGHTLAAQSIQLENALLHWQSHWPKEVQRIHPFLLESRRLVGDALQEVRQSVGALRANPLQNQSLENLLHHLLQEFSEMTGIQPQIQLNLPPTLPLAVTTSLYRLVQEGLTNIRKHAQATEVQLDLRSDQEGITLVIQDNGRGFNPDHISSGFGLQGMQERLTALGGSLQIQSQPGQGCCLRIQIPQSILGGRHDPSDSG